MIEGSEKRNGQLAFELQNSHVCEKRSKLTSESNTRVLTTSQLDKHHICFFYVPDQSPSQVP